MKFKKTISIILTLILVLSLSPLYMVAEAKNQNQRNAVEVATAAVEQAEQHRTWSYVDKAQTEINNLGNGRAIRDSKQDLQNRLNVVKVYIKDKEANQNEEEPVEEPKQKEPEEPKEETPEDPVEEEPKEETPQEPINEDPTEEEVQAAVYHIIQPGDTLWLISITYGVTVDKIKQLNNLTSDMIFVGQKLLIIEGTEVVEKKDPVDEMMILGYYTKYWSSDLGSYRSLTANHEYLNAIATASVDVNYDGTITGFIPHEALKFSNENDVFTYATFQNHFDPNLTRAIFTDSTLQQTVISNMVSFVKEHGYKGANLNFENMFAADRSLFNNFLEEMTVAFHEEGYPVMVSVPAKTCDCPTWAWSGTFDFEFLGNSNVDYIQLMSYDQHGAWSSPGPIAGYDWMQVVLNYATSHIASEKILLGLPGYGYSWNTSKNSGHRALTLKQIDQLIATHNPEIMWDAKEKTPYFNYVDGSGDRHTVYFDNFDSLSAKTSLVYDFNLAGVSMWRLGQENDQFWLAVEDGLNRK